MDSAIQYVELNDETKRGQELILVAQKELLHSDDDDDQEVQRLKEEVKELKDRLDSDGSGGGGETKEGSGMRAAHDDAIKELAAAKKEFVMLNNKQRTFTNAQRSKIQTLEEELAGVDEKLDTAIKERDDAKKKLSVYLRSTLTEQETKDTLDTAIKERAAEFDELKVGFRNDLRVAKEELRVAKEELRAKESDSMQVAAERDAAIKEIGKQNKKRDASIKEIGKQYKKRDALKRETEQLMVIGKQYKAKLAAAEEELRAKESDSKQYKAELAAAEEERDTLKQQTKRLMVIGNRYKAELAAAKKELRDKESETESKLADLLQLSRKDMGMLSPDSINTLPFTYNSGAMNIEHPRGEQTTDPNDQEIPTVKKTYPLSPGGDPPPGETKNGGGPDRKLERKLEFPEKQISRKKPISRTSSRKSSGRTSEVSKTPSDKSKRRGKKKKYLAKGTGAQGSGGSRGYSDYVGPGSNIKIGSFKAGNYRVGFRF